MANDTNTSQRAPSLLPISAAAGVQRALKTWLNTCTELPASAPSVSFEDLQANESCICFASLVSPAYAAKYILGGYKAEYKWRIIYRVLPSDDGDILDAVETLSKIAGWCETATPPEITGAVNAHVARDSDVAILAAYEDGSNDYYVDFTISWEVF